ncbi:transposase [Ottowia massiliensis]|uniref:transposase n=1 Tax=Ottowia massiliensis TaxID=2045302 RepID=UPI000C864AA8
MTDAQWAHVQDLLSGRAGPYGMPCSQSRLFVDAALYRCRAEIPWRDPPERLSPKSSQGPDHAPNASNLDKCFG